MKKTIYLLLAVSLIFTSCQKEGCTDSIASNYNPDAGKDDGSCTYDIIGSWSATTVVVDTSVTVTINGTVDPTMSGSGSMTATPSEAETPTNIEFFSDGSVTLGFSYISETNTGSYTKSGNNITINDGWEDLDLTYTVNKNNLTLTQSESMQIGNPNINGYVYDYTYDITLNFNRD